MRDCAWPASTMSYSTKSSAVSAGMGCMVGREAMLPRQAFGRIGRHAARRDSIDRDLRASSSKPGLRPRRRGALFLIVDVGCGRRLLRPAQQVGYCLLPTCYVGNRAFCQTSDNTWKCERRGRISAVEKIIGRKAGFAGRFVGRFFDAAIAGKPAAQAMADFAAPFVTRQYQLQRTAAGPGETRRRERPESHLVPGTASNRETL